MKKLQTSYRLVAYILIIGLLFTTSAQASSPNTSERLYATHSSSTLTASQIIPGESGIPVGAKVVQTAARVSSPKLPPTFQTGEQPQTAYEYAGKENTAVNAVEDIPTAQTPVPGALSRIQRVEVQAIEKLLDSADVYSKLSTHDAEKVCGFFSVDGETMRKLETAGKNLGDSLLYAQLVSQFSFPVATLLKQYTSQESCMGLFSEMELYEDYLAPSLIGSPIDEQLRSYILFGATFEAVKHAYAIHKGLGIGLDALLKTQRISTSDSKSDLPATEAKNYRAFSSDLGINQQALIQYAAEQELDFQALERAIEANLEYAEELSGQTPVLANAGTGQESTPEERILAPYAYDQNQSEAISINTGALVRQEVDVTLPGRNGLNLTIARHYDSGEAGIYTPAKKMHMEPIYKYRGGYKWNAYWVKPSTGRRSRRSANDIPWAYSGYDFWDASSARAWARAQGSNIYIPNYYGTGQDLELVFTTTTGSQYIAHDIWYTAGTEDNTYFNNLYGLGQGWRFAFSSIESRGADKYLHLADGRIFELEITEALGNSNLKDYWLRDLRIEEENAAYSNGTVASTHTLYYKDGKREFFSADGKLIGIRDRFGNTINFVNAMQNGLPKITITDTLGREVILAGESTGSGHVMSITLPDAALQYTVNTVPSYINGRALSKVENQLGHETNYSYTLDIGGFNTLARNTSGAYNCFLNLTAITHPTGYQTVYTYQGHTKNLARSGLQVGYRVIQRADVSGGVEYGKKTYDYSSNNYTGYPTCTNPASLPYDYTYHALVTDQGTGLSTTAIFEWQHLQISSQTKKNTVLVASQEIEYWPNYKLPTRVTTRAYDPSGSAYMETATVTQYDNRGNIVAAWSPGAQGDTANTAYKVAYTYDDMYSLCLSRTFQQNGDTTIVKQATLSSSGTHIALQETKVNGVLKEKTGLEYDAYGNLAAINRYGDDFIAYTQTQYTYQNGADLVQILYAGVEDATGVPVQGTPEYTDGTIAIRYTYDSMGRPVKHTDPNGNETRYAYNALGDMTLQTNSDDTTIRYTRDYATNTLTVTDENSNSIRYNYTPLGYEQDVVDVESGALLIRKEYDTSLRIALETDMVHDISTAYLYDHLGRVIQKETKQDANITLRKETYAYNDAYGNGAFQRIEATLHGDSHAPSNVTTQYVDMLGNVAKTGRVYNGTEYVDAYTYDYLGNCVTAQSAYSSGLGLAYTSRWEYDYAGRVVKTYDAPGNYATTVYDALGCQVETTDFAGATTTYTYDSMGRLLSERMPVGQNNSDTQYALRHYFYDAAGNITETRVSNNPVGSAYTFTRTQYRYNERNRLQAVALFHGATIDNVTRYSYDGAGNTTAMRTGLEGFSASGGQLTVYTYDRFGNMRTVTDPLGQTEQYSYDLLGWLTAKEDRNGVTTAYTYDGLGRLLTAAAGAEALQFTYTLTGNKRSESSGVLSATNRYDALGRLVQVSQSDGVEKTYAYDIGDNRVAFTAEVNSTDLQNTTYTYDNMSRLSTVRDDGTLVATYTYNPNGSRASLSYANGLSTQYSYNQASWLTGLENRKDSTVLSTYAYTYYADGNQRTKQQGSTTTTYAYDGTGRLVSEYESNGPDVSYVYDRYSNRVEMDVSSGDSYTVTYAYDANNRLLQDITHQNDVERITNYQYDPNGNLLSKMREMYEPAAITPQPQLSLELGADIYRYDAFNRLIGAFTEEGQVWYTYRADGLRHSKSLNGLATITHIWDGTNITADVAQSGTAVRYVRGANLLTSDDGTSLQYYLYNGHGDVVQLTNGSGTVTQTYDYDAFGNEKNPADADTNPFRYCGEYFDISSGTYYLRARYYNPSTGRFLAEDTHWNPTNMIYGDNPIKINERQDPLGLNVYTYMPDIAAIRQSSNLYVYCGNNPLMYIDPTGEAWYHWVIGGAIVVAAAAAVVVTAGGALPALYAVGAVASGTAAATTASTVAAGAFIGSSAVMGGALLMADYSSINSFNASANWGTVAFTAGGLLVGGAAGYTLYKNNNITIAGKGSTGRVEAANLNEQLAMKQVMSDPLKGATQVNVTMTDSRWLASDGWVKMQNIVKLSDGTKINIHYVYNTVTKAFDDFKFK